MSGSPLLGNDGPFFGKENQEETAVKRFVQPFRFPKLTVNLQSQWLKHVETGHFLSPPA